VLLRIEFLEATGIKRSMFAHNIEPGPNAYQKPENRGGLERPNRVVLSNDGRTCMSQTTARSLPICR
jgi:hypothetical protein